MAGKKLRIGLIVAALLVALGGVVNYLFPTTCGISYYYVDLRDGGTWTLHEGIVPGAHAVEYRENAFAEALQRYEPECVDLMASADVLVATRERGLLYYSGYALVENPRGPSDAHAAALAHAQLLAQVVLDHSDQLSEEEARSLLCEALRKLRLGRDEPVYEAASSLLDRIPSATEKRYRN